MKIKPTLGYAGAALTIALAIATPFVLMGAFAKGIGRLPLHVDDMYGGGARVRTVSMSGYSINIHQAFKPHMLQRARPFVQLAWTPVSALPPRVNDAVDIDGDGKPDVKLTFDAPKDPKAPLRVEVEALNKDFQPMHDVGKKSFSELIVRVDDSIIVRIPKAAK
jgi:hypothetical protein